MIKNYFTLIFILLFSTFSSLAQVGKSNSACDCHGAVTLEDTVISNVKIIKGKGVINDFVNFPSDFPIKDKNIVWILAEAPFDGEFGFDIEFDSLVEPKFVVFKSSSLDFCDELEKGYVRPDVINLKSKYGKTGLKLNPENGYMPPIKVKSNDQIYIAINANKKEAKFKFDPHFFPSDGVVVSKKEHKVYNLAKNLEKNNLIIEFVDADNNEPVYANVTFTGNRLEKYAFSGSYFKFDIFRTGLITMSIMAKGYFFEFIKKEIRADSEQKIKVELQRLVVGKKLNLPDVKFYMGSDEFLETAYVTLKRLYDFMVLNNKIRINIEGHVNGPKMENNREMQKLSEKRAKAVYEYLVENGIEKERLEFKGFGNLMMLYEEPVNPEEEEKNRRVEIQIIE